MILPSDPAVQFKKKELNGFSSEVERCTTDQEDIEPYRAKQSSGLCEELVSPQCYINYEQNGLNQEMESWYAGK